MARLRVAAAVALSLVSSLAFAHSVGTVFSSPVDGDVAAVSWNPAAMSLVPTSRFDLVLNGQILQGNYQRAGIDTGQTGKPFPRVSLVTVRPEPVIGVIIDKLWHKRLRLGFTVSLPDAVGAAWPRTVEQNGQPILGPTRYHVTDAQIFHVFMQLGASFVLHPTFSLGVSLNVVVSHLDVQKDIDLVNQPAFANIVTCAQNPIGCESAAASTPIHLKGNGVSAGATIGALWMPKPWVRIGASYQSPVKVPVGLQVSVDAQQLDTYAHQFFPGYGTVAITGTGTTSITVPQRAHFAIAFDVHPRIELMALVRWINYSATEVVSGSVTQKSSTLVPSSLSIPSIRNDGFTGILRIIGRVKERTRLAFSLEYANASVPDAFMTPSNLDFDNLNFNFGAQVRVTKSIYLGASFTQTLVIPRTITASAYSDQSPAPYNLPNPSGTYGGNDKRIGLDVSARF